MRLPRVARRIRRPIRRREAFETIKPGCGDEPLLPLNTANVWMVDAAKT
jgi:hypothetical protein